MPQPMRVVAFTSQKGGSGKTTLCGHLAVQAEICGAGPVAMIDTDPQGSLEKWAEGRHAETPLFVGGADRNLPSLVKEARSTGARLVFVDTPPSVTRAISEVVAASDLVIVPTRPSPHDLRAVGATIDIAEWHGKQMLFVINSATARARITADAAVALSQHGTVAPVTVHHRVEFAASMIDGRTVVESRPQGRSAKEIEGLWTYLADRLDRLVPAEERGIDPSDDVLPRTHINSLGRRAPAFGRRAGQ